LAYLQDLHKYYVLIEMNYMNIRSVVDLQGIIKISPHPKRLRERAHARPKWC